VYRTYVAFLLVCCLFLIPTPAQETPRELEETVDGTVAIEQETQQIKDDWAVERDQLLARRRTALANREYLEERREVLSARRDALEERVAELRRRLGESARLETSIQDTLVRILQRLEQVVHDDLPFLPEERARRLAMLRDELARPDTTPAERLRRLMEALQIEAHYGSGIEVYGDRIEVDGDSLFVDVLRVGRLSLFWQTTDGRRAGEYDRVTGAWVPLSGTHRRSIGRAIEMARRRRPYELIALPLGRIEP